MPIDSSIYFQQQTPDLFGSYQEGMKMGDMIRQQQKQRAIDTAFKEGYKTTPDGKTAYDHNTTMSGLFKADPQFATQYDQQYKAKQAAQQEQQLKLNQHLSDLAANTLYNINNAKTDEEKNNAYLFGISKANEIGGNTSNMSPTLTPESLTRLKNIAGYSTDSKTKFDEADKNRKFKLDQDKFDFEKSKTKDDKSKTAAALAQELRKERSGLPTTKATQDVAAAYNKIRKASEIPSAAGDLSIIFSYNKMLDPGSTVREGEFANAQNAAGWTDQARNMYNKALSGQRLNPEQRADFIKQSENLYMGQLDLQNQIDSTYKNLATKGGVDPSDVLVNFEASKSVKSPLNQSPNAPLNPGTSAINPKTDFSKLSDKDLANLYKQHGGR